MVRGRPVTFDKAETLGKSMDVFWKEGFLGASYADLCAATGLTKPSLYAAYGNKEAMFLAALELYVQRNVAPNLAILDEGHSAREAIHSFLVSTAESLCASDNPPGCMIVSNLSCASEPDVPNEIIAALKNAIKLTPNAIQQRLLRADPSELPEDTDPEGLALYFESVLLGLFTLARQQKECTELFEIVNYSMRVWQK